MFYNDLCYVSLNTQHCKMIHSKIMPFLVSVLLTPRSVEIEELRSLKVNLEGSVSHELSHEREELACAYKDADAGKQKALDRVAALKKELAKLKTDFEKKFGGAREVFEVAKRKLVEEINLFTRKLADSENKLRVEVEQIKKKMAITELEIALDASNKYNGQL